MSQHQQFNFKDKDALLKKINELASVEKAFIMQHATYDGDLIVFMLWNNEVKPDKTREGLMIAERLQELGTIDHAVWIPAEMNN